MSATSSGQRRALWPHPFGELYEDSSRKPPAIVNVLCREVGREPDALDYLERITGALASIDSPFLASMRGAGIEGDGRIVLAYERIDGEGLSALLAHGALPVERAVAVLRQLCRGLATAHAAGINHRALGPASIVVQSGGPHPDAVKILDFGLAGVLGEAEPKYSPLVPMTPERLLGFGTHTSEDVYLVGCVGYWMLAGVPPFTGEDIDALRRRHAIEDVAPLRSVSRHVPAALARAIEEALVKDPDDRTTDLAALELALIAAQREAGIVTAWDTDIAAQTERARTEGESPATSGVFQTVSGRGGKRSPSGSHRPVTVAANSPGRSIVASGPSSRAATPSSGAPVPSGSKMPRPHGAAPIHTKVVRPIAESPAKPVEAKPVEAKPVEAKPAEAKPAEAKPVEAKPVEAKPVEAKPAEAKPAEAKPAAKPANPGRIPPPPRVSNRPAPTMRIQVPELASAPAKEASTPSAATSSVGLTLEDVDELAAGLNVPPLPTARSPRPLTPALIVAPTQILLKGPILVPPTIAPASGDAASATIDAASSGPRAMPARPDAIETAITDRTDAETLVETSLSGETAARRPAWLVPAIAALGIVTVLAIAFGGNDPEPSTPAPTVATQIATSSVPSPAKPLPTSTPATPPRQPPSDAPELVVAAPPIAEPPIAEPPIAEPPIPESPIAEPPIPESPIAAPSPEPPKPVVTVDPVRQQLVRAKDARRRGKRDEAIAAYQSVLRLEPGNRTALRELSRFYFDAGNYESAVRYGKQLVGAAGSAADRVALGDAYFKLGRTADAKAQYQKAAASGDATAKKRLAKIGA